MIPAENNTLDRAIMAVAGRAAALDQHSTDVREDLNALGAAGLFDPALAVSGLPDLVRTIDLMAAHSMAASLSTWGHIMVLEYLRSASKTLRDKYIDALRTGSRIGVTAVDAGLEHVAGLSPVPVIAHRDGTALQITGPVRWASNVFDDAVLVVAARGAADDTYVVVLDINTPGITINPPVAMMALASTASTSLQLTNVHVASNQILSTDLMEFTNRFRPSYLLLQAALCAGIGGAALAAAEATGGLLVEQFAAEFSELSTCNRLLRQRLYGLARERSRVHPAAFVRLRLDAVTLASSATRLEATLAGVAGLDAAGATNRRFREAAILPVLSPTEGQLRWELSQYRL
ncbi:acyl-CoA dehydrogenase family protein [soil metagenome]